MQKVKTKGGAVLLWRLGTLEFGKQDRWSRRAPESRGLWAFPWPYFDMFFAYHKYKDLFPKSFKTTDVGYPLSPSSYEYLDGSTPTSVDFDNEGRPTDDELLVKEGWSEEKERWIENVGKKVLPLRKFWYEGELYSHMNHRGEIGDVGLFSEPDWYKVHSSVFAKAVHRNNGNRFAEVIGAGKGISYYRSSVDHLEVFIPPRAGHITGNFKK